MVVDAPVARAESVVERAESSAALPDEEGVEAADEEADDRRSGGPASG